MKTTIIDKHVLKPRVLLPFTIISIIGLTFIIYFSYINNDAFRVAKNSALTDKEIIKQLGNVKSIYLLPWGGAVRYQGDEGDAKFIIYIVGEHKSIPCKFILERRMGKWSVKTHSLMSAPK